MMPSMAKKTMVPPSKIGMGSRLRIPSIMAKDLLLENGSEVDLIEETDKIIIQPKKTPRLQDLLEAINESNIHEEISADEPLGNEAW